MCWVRFALSTECCVSGKRCVQPSIVLRCLLQIGSVLIAKLNGPRTEDWRTPLGEEARKAFAEEIGEQGRELLDALFDPTAPQWLRHVPAVEILRQVWVQNYQRIDDAVGWRSCENIPPASRYIGSPYDEEAHDSKKR